VLVENDDPPVRVVMALGQASYEWTPEVAPRLVARVSAARSAKLRVALAYALLFAGKALGVHGPAAVKAIRASAQRSPDPSSREALLDVASRLAEDLGEEPMQDRGGLPLETPPELGGSGDDPCHLLFSALRVHPLLRFTPAAWPHSDREGLRTTFGTSGVEVYRPAEDE
jgi:hypothetical protein